VRPQRLELFGCGDARVDFDGPFVAGGAVRQPLGEAAQQLPQRFGRQKGRRAAAEMQLRHRPLTQAFHLTEVEIELRQHQRHVRSAAVMVAGNDRVAAAEGAECFAERQVHVDRK
jgi:hypothetical protein